MAIDGIKIIDSDLGYDIRNQIMQAYDYNENLTELLTTIEAWEAEVADDEIEHEIFITAYAQCLWEIGLLNEKWQQKAKQIVQRGASPQWEKFAKNTQAKRQKSLEKFWEKISQPNPKPRKSKNYKRITDFIFEENEVVAVKLADGTFGFLILVDIDYENGQCYYGFAKINYVAEHIPTLDFLKRQYIPARKGLGFDSPVLIKHKDLGKLQSYFEPLGKLIINSDPAIKRFGTYRGNVRSYAELNDDWVGDFDQKQYPLEQFLIE